MTSREKRINRRNKKRERAFFCVQKICGGTLVFIGVIPILLDRDATCLCFSLLGCWLMFSNHKILEDWHEYEVYQRNLYNVDEMERLYLLKK